MFVKELGLVYVNVMGAPVRPIEGGEKAMAAAGSWVPLGAQDMVHVAQAEGAHEPGDELSLLLFLIGLKGAPNNL